MNERKLIRVRDVMKPGYDVVDGMATIEDAIKAMEHTENKCLIVKKRHENDEIGMLLITDIARKVLARDRAADRVNVYEIMAKPVINVHAGMDIRYCARLFERFDLTRAPVVDGDEVIGVVSLSDLVYRGLLQQ
jgi:CBS domain-containing protein